ncbi:MAG TPA: TatD family hydrolase [Candidatus Nanoarchaeia archaeon]|nr:TatD family hydrolase [Candidatus Nanoarchaeia archaeon]
MLVDTHAHIHFDDFSDDVLSAAKAAGVEKIVTIGVDAADSAKAVEFAQAHDNVYATVGLHPHDAKHGNEAAQAQLSKLAGESKVVAIGECGLDFYRNLSDKHSQEKTFRYQIELAQKNNLPMVWHVRDAFDEFFKIVDEYSGLRGIVHCFTSNRANMEKAIERGFMVALNGIMTFTRDESQLNAAKNLPLSNLVLETDCPFLTPVPLRGKPNQPAYIKFTAEFLAKLRAESFEELAEASSSNAVRLLRLT